MSSPAQWLPAISKSAASMPLPSSVTSTAAPSSAISVLRGRRTNPSARLKAVTEPLPLPMGQALSSPAPSSPSPTSRYSSRPRSERVCIARRALRVSRRCGGRPAMSRSSGATNSWKVKTAEVGKPGKITTGLRPAAARQMGLPGLSATPCTMMPGSSSATTRAFRSPSPFEVPPESSTRSAPRNAACSAPRSADSSSGCAPRKCGVQPSSRTASARMRPLLS